MSRTRNVAVLASTALTATDVTTAQVVAGEPSYLALHVVVSVASGTTPTLDLTVEWSADGTNFAIVDTTADAFAQLTTTATVVKLFTIKGTHYRVRYTIGGTTPSFTTAINGVTY